MLATIQSFIRSAIEPSREAGADEPSTGLRLAAAALLVEVAAADFEQQPAEREAVKRALHQVFGLGEQTVEELVVDAQYHHHNATSLYEFTRVLNKGCTVEDKLEILTHMWRVAFADGRLDKYEDHRIRRVADLLHIPHRQFIQAKLKAQESQEKG